MQQKLRILNSQLSTPNLENGQALLIVVLVMVIALTVGLSVASRTIVHIRTTTDEANSQKAFSAAEAGIERALKLNVTPIPNFSLGEGANIQNVTINQVGNKVEISLNGGNPIPQDDGVDVWLVDHVDNPDSPNYGEIDYSSGWRKLKDDQDLTLYWGTSGACESSALELIIITKNWQPSPSSNISSKRYAFDPCTSRAGNNKFCTLGSPCSSGTIGTGGLADGKTYSFSATITIPADVSPKKNMGVLVRIVPLYKDASVGVKVLLPCNDNSPPGNKDCYFPQQGKIIESTGEAGGAVRKVVYYQGYRKLPSEFFQYVLFSHRR